MNTTNNLNKKIIARNFSQSAKNYDQSSQIQKLSAKKLCELSSPFIKDNNIIVDLGSGTSAIYKNLFSSNTKKNLQAFEIDLSEEMLGSWSGKSENKIKSIISDIDNLPLKRNSCDVIISSFSLQWIKNFNKLFNDLNLSLKKDGILALCLPDSSSLRELRSSSVESGCNFSFIDLPKITDLERNLQESGFKRLIIQSETLKSEFDDGSQALKSLKIIGANYSQENRHVSKSQLNHFNNLCLKNFSNSNKKLAISWDITYFIASKL